MIFRGTHFNWLVVLTILKNMKVNGKDDIPYMKWKIKVMFETTNQPWNILETIGYNGIEWDMMGYNIDWNIYIYGI